MNLEEDRKWDEKKMRSTFYLSPYKLRKYFFFIKSHSLKHPDLYCNNFGIEKLQAQKI